jgi:hypothetical protein
MSNIPKKKIKYIDTEWISKLKCKEKILNNPNSLYNIALCQISNNNKFSEINYLRNINLPLDNNNKIFTVTICRGKKNLNKNYYTWMKDYKCTQKELIYNNHNIFFETTHIKCILS